MLNEDRLPHTSPKPPESTAIFLKIPEWLRYDPSDPKQRPDAGIEYAKGHLP